MKLKGTFFAAYRHSGCSSGGRPVQRGSSKLSTFKRMLSTEIYKLSPLLLGSAPLSSSKSTSSGRSLIAAQWRGVTPASSPLPPAPASSFKSCFTLYHNVISVPAPQDSTFPERHAVQPAPGPKYSGRQLGEAPPIHLARSQ